MAFVKSVFWLVGCTGFAWVLLKTITPDEAELRKTLAGDHRGDPKQRAAFFEGLRKASREKKSMIQEQQSSKISSTPTVVEK